MFAKHVRFPLACGSEPRRCQKEILGLLNFPVELNEELEKCCTRTEKESKDPTKRYLPEDFLLKPGIPFIRIAHLPRGRYFQLKGDLIMVSADVAQSMNEILPQDQNLLPVAFKRKIEYKGYYLQEYVDRQKIQIYFKWFQRHNHLFKDMTLNEELINKFEKEALEAVEEIDTEKDKLMTDHGVIRSQIGQIKDEIYDSDEEEQLSSVVKLEKEVFVSDHSSVIVDKYVEDTKAPTVANKLSDVIISFEKIFSSENEDINP